MSMSILIALLLAGAARPLPDMARPLALDAVTEPQLREQIRGLEAKTKRDRRDVKSWNALAVAWRRLARLTGDHTSDDRAWDAVAAALAADPRDDDALALKGWVQAGRHDFEGAAVSARAAIAARPEGAWSYGVLADALTELGRYPEAVDAVEAMMRRRPGAGAYSRAAHLRALHGDRQGALSLMKLAVEASSPTDPEGFAWCRVMLGREYQAQGQHALARDQYRMALVLVLGYHLALFQLAESQAAAGELDAAVATAENLRRTAPSVAASALLADLHAATGHPDRAAVLEAEVDAVAALRDPSRAEPRWLARFYADHGRNLEAAILLVEEELKTHRDVETWDGLAWALHRAGRHAEALAASEKALALGTVDARLLYHRGMIESSLGREAEAREHLEQSLGLRNLWPCERAAAERALSHAQARR